MIMYSSDELDPFKIVSQSVAEDGVIGIGFRFERADDPPAEVGARNPRVSQSIMDNFQGFER